MSFRPAPDGLLNWALSALAVQDGGEQPPLLPVAGDASHRRYFRFAVDGHRYVVASAPPATEKNAAFLAVGKLLATAGVKVPTLFAADLERGFLLLEDLGDDLLLSALSADTVDDYYHSACDVLCQIAAVDCENAGLPHYDQPLLAEELDRFSVWFVQALLGYQPDTAEHALLRDFSAKLIHSALTQPRVLVHRDFHSRNLMLADDGTLGVIDFQDAVAGPVSYDLVSLLRDCYIQWPQDQVVAWALGHRDTLCSRGLLAPTDDATFIGWFDWMGLQRHIKVLGTFARLYLRDDKSSYLKDLPLVIEYVLTVTDKYTDQEPLFREFHDWFTTRLSPLIVQREWGEIQ